MGNNNKLTQEQVIQQFREKHGNTYIYDRVEYINEKTKVWIGCKEDGHGYFEQTPNAHKQGVGCNKCKGNKISKSKLLLLSDIKERLKLINPNIEILDDEYINSQSKLKCRCLIDGFEFEATWNNLSRGRGCIKCANLKSSILYSTPNGNSIYDLRPDLVEYFTNPEDAKKYMVNSDRKVQLKCPKCGTLKGKQISVKQLSRCGFSCDYCSDGISIPEKFGIYLFQQIGVKFEIQKNFVWSNRKRYDICFELNNEIFIIEIHGEQHYKYSGFKRTLIQEQENDLLKYNLAIQNGIKPENYIIIDCRKSEFEWLKENFIEQLQDYFDLSNINWSLIFTNCQKSFVIEISELWNELGENASRYMICNELGLNRQFVIKYLKIGKEIGLCSYDTKKEMSKGGKLSGINKSKKVYQYTLDEKYVRSFKSAHDAMREIGISNKYISKCALDNRKTAGGFKWSYLPPEEYLKSLEK